MFKFPSGKTDPFFIYLLIVGGTILALAWFGPKFLPPDLLNGPTPTPVPAQVEITDATMEAVASQVIATVTAQASAVGQLDPACQRWLQQNPPRPGAQFRLLLSTSVIDVEMRVGETVEVMRISSTELGGFNFCGYPEPPAPGLIYWDAWSGGLRPGLTTVVHLTAKQPGVFTGKVLLIDLTSGLSKEIPVNIVVKAR